MEALKKDVQVMVKELKVLTKHAERLGNKLDKLYKTTNAKKKTAKTQIKAAKVIKQPTASKGNGASQKNVPASDVVYKIIRRSRKFVAYLSV